MNEYYVVTCYWCGYKIINSDSAAAYGFCCEKCYSEWAE